MSWNWGVFLKSILFAFLGFLIGIVSTVIYLAVDVDLSQFDGLQILTAVLIVITIWYAYSTHKMLDEQRKSKKIADIKKAPFGGKINCCLQNVDLMSPVLGL